MIAYLDAEELNEIVRRIKEKRFDAVRICCEEPDEAKRVKAQGIYEAMNWILLQLSDEEEVHKPDYRNFGPEI